MADQNTPPKEVRRSISVTTVRGYKCASCGAETKIYGDGPAPTSCIDCGAPNPVQAYKNIVKTTTEVLVV